MAFLVTHSYLGGGTNSTNIFFRIQFYPSLQTMKSVNMDEEMILNERNSTTSSCLSSLSSTLSLTENDNDDDGMELFPQINPIIPRLAMQASHQIQY